MLAVYVPRHFGVDEPAEIVGLLRDAGFGHLVLAGDDGLASTPMPFLVDDELRSVRAHLARPNPIWRQAPCDALLIVPVRDAYVSPSWYPSKQVDGRVVPTWNYDVVHLGGHLEVRDDDAFVLAQIRDLTDQHERGFDEPWSVDDPPDGFVEQTRRGIVGIELTVTSVTAKRKLGQNRSDADRNGASDGLSDRDHRSDAVARAMRSHGRSPAGEA